MGTISGSSLVYGTEVRSATIVVAASDSKYTGQADYYCPGTDDQVGIQAAIDALPAGGGKVLLLEGRYNCTNKVSITTDYVTIGGVGWSTELFLQSIPGGWVGYDGIITLTGADYCIVRDLKVNGNNGVIVTESCGMVLRGCSDCRVINVLGYETRNAAIALDNLTGAGVADGSMRCTVDDCHSYDTRCHSFFIDHGSKHNTISNCIAKGTTAFGFGIYRGSEFNTIIGSRDHSSAWNCLEVVEADNNLITGCQGWEGNYFTRLVDAHYNHFIGNYAHDETQFANFVTTASTHNFFKANMLDTCVTVLQFDVDGCHHNVFEDNKVDGYTTFIGLGGGITRPLIQVKNNIGLDITDDCVLVKVKNTSGGALVAGDVVILKAVAAGNEITTTVNQGDDKVFGMVAEGIADNASGKVLITGKTVVLKVDGTADIAIGDLLGTFTAAKIAMQAQAGDMAFAIALEVYAANDSNGVIDALLIKPRKV